MQDHETEGDEVVMRNDQRRIPSREPRGKRLEVMKAGRQREVEDLTGTGVPAVDENGRVGGTGQQPQQAGRRALGGPGRSSAGPPG